MVKDLRALSAKWHLRKSSSNSINNKLLLLNFGFMTGIAEHSAAENILIMNMIMNCKLLLKILIMNTM